MKKGKIMSAATNRCNFLRLLGTVPLCALANPKILSDALKPEPVGEVWSNNHEHHIMPQSEWGASTRNLSYTNSLAMDVTGDLGNLGKFMWVNEKQEWLERAVNHLRGANAPEVKIILKRKKKHNNCISRIHVGFCQRGV